MCPVCFATLALIAAGATSTAGVTALVVKRLRAKHGADPIEGINQTKGAENGASERRLSG